MKPQMRSDMRKGSYIFSLILFALSSTLVHSQDPNFDPFKDTIPKGVSVSPPTIRFSLKPGTSQSKQIKISNDTDVARTFQVKVQDYLAADINRAAENSQVPDDYKYGLKKWLYVTPSVITVQPGQKASINVLLDVPAGDEFAHAGWSLIVIDEVKERQELNVPSQGNNAMGMGIVPSMGFGIFVYQNPPNLLNNQIEMTGYSISVDKKIISMKASNTGDGIGFCTYYVELLNMATGETIKVPAKTATVLPGATRMLEVELPLLSSGSYNALGVLDFGSKDYVETAELDFAIP
jgi:P pilus assembly chaperone PapD